MKLVVGKYEPQEEKLFLQLEEDKGNGNGIVYLKGTVNGKEQYLAAIYPNGRVYFQKAYFPNGTFELYVV